MIKRYQPGDIVLGEWELVSEIGSGGYSTVYEARRKDHGQVYTSAIKIIPIPRDQSELEKYIFESQSEKDAYAYFHEEMQKRYGEVIRMFQLKGRSNVVSYEDHKVVDCEGGIGWDIIIRMELLTPLKRHLGSCDFTRRDAVQLGIDICKALELCHGNDIHHRDVKLDNIFVSPHGDYKLGDLGISKKRLHSHSVSSLGGSDDYIPPEFYKGEVSMLGDLYSLGIVLYKLTNNRLAPFLDKPGEDENAWIRRMSGEPFPDPAKGDPALNSVIMKACASEPADRYQSAAQMREALEALLDDGVNGILIPKYAKPSGYAAGMGTKRTDPDQSGGGQRNPAPSPKMVRNIAILAAVLALLIVGVWMLYSSGGDDITVSLPEIAALGKGGEAVLPYTLSEEGADGAQLHWTSEDADVLTVEQGILTGVGVGETNVTAAYGDNTDTCRVLVLAQDLDDQLYELTDAGWYYDAQGEGALVCVEDAYYWHDGQTAASDELLSLLNQAAVQELAMQSLDRETNWLDCYLDENGTDYCGSVLLASGEAGETVVVVHTLEDTYILGLNEILPPEEAYTQLRMEETAVTMYVGDQRALKVYCVYEDGSVALAEELTWICTDSAVVSVENGIVTATACGSTMITATDGEFSCVCTVTVEEPIPEETEAPTEKETTGKPTGGNTTTKPTTSTTKPTTSTTKPTTSTTKPTTPPVTDPPETDPPATEPPATDPPATEPPVTDPPVTDPPATDPPVTEPQGKAPSSYTISLSSSSVYLYQPFLVTVRPDVSDYTKIVIHAIDPTGGRWDFTISDGNTYDLEVYDASLTGTWTLYADVYNAYGVLYGASGGARVALTVYALPI